MAHEYFDPVLFIKEDAPMPVDLTQTPFFCNIDGYPSYRASADEMERISPTVNEPENPPGQPYDVLSTTTTHPAPQYGCQTLLELRTQPGERVHYQRLDATSDNAAAFGLTLVAPGQAIEISSPHQPKLSQVDIEYGMFAGHQSPYEGTRSRLLGKVCTDLEQHDFPHIFASIDPHLPLVISVARYWLTTQRIYLADLWVPQGQALYVPPRPSQRGRLFMDLHGNRNSALACWQDSKRTSLRTQTLLQTEGSYFHWFWNPLPTSHPLPEPATGAPDA